MTKRRTIPALMAATLGLGATAAWAEQPQAAGQDMQKQIEALQAQIAQLQQQQAHRAATPAYTAKDVDATVSSVLSDADRRSQLLADGGGVGAGWMDGGFRIRSADGNYELQPFAQFQFRHVLNLTDGGDDEESDFESGEGFEVRRMKFGIQGTAVSPKLGYHFRWASDRNGGALNLEQAFVTYAFADNMRVKAGQWKDNWTHEESVSSGRQLAVDRSLLNEMIAGGETDYVQGVALMWDGGAIRGELAWHDGANSDNTNFQDQGSNFGISGRLEGLLQGDWKAYDDFSAMNNRRSLLAVGGGFDWTQAGDTNVFYHTVDVQWENTAGLGVYGAYVGRWVDLGGADDDSVCDFGILGQVGYLFNRDWEAFGRFSWVMMDDEFLAPDAEDNVLELTIGVNYFIRGHNAKFTIDGTWLPNGSPENQTGIGVVGQPDDNDQFILRTQFQLMI
jgi:hypothetical protein